jgi:hypothetical protein
MSCLDIFTDWRTFALWASAVFGVSCILYLVWRTQKMVDEFRIVDLVLEGDPPKASISKLILLVFASLSIWVVVLSVLDNKIDPGVGNLLLGVLGIFVIGRTASQGINQLANRPRVEVHQTEVVIDEPQTERPPAKPKRESIIK